MRRLRGKLTYANLVSTLCLFLLLGGGAYAATNLPANSIGTKQLKSGAVTGAKVKSGSLLASNFGAGQIPAGSQGLKGENGREGEEGREGVEGVRGEKGEPGKQGEPGATNVVTRYGPESSDITGNTAGSYAVCESGEAVTGGGYDFLIAPVSASFILEANRPSVEITMKTMNHFPPPANGGKPGGWQVSMANNTGATFSFRSYVMCASP